MTSLRRTYRYRLYPTRRQVEALEQQLREACDLYNAALEHKRWLYKEHGVAVGRNDQAAELKKMRHECLLDPTSNFTSQYMVLRRVEYAFNGFFRRVKAGEFPGYPRFKRRQEFATLQWSFAGNAGGIKLMENGRLRLQNVGHVKVKMHRPIPKGAKPCEATVTRRAGKWHVAISLKDVPANPLPETGQEVGIDLGITTFAATSDGEPIEGPRAQRAAAAKVRCAQRKLARRQRGSNRRRKAVILLGRQREHEANRRRDHAFKTAADLVKRFDVICAEELNVRGLARSRLARDVHDQGWGQFVACLRDKVEETGRELVLVDPKNTSQECSACGAIVPKDLSVRVHRCDCGYTADRDVNAARNILARGLGRSPQAITVGEEAKPSPEKPRKRSRHIRTPLLPPDGTG